MNLKEAMLNLKLILNTVRIIKVKWPKNYFWKRYFFNNEIRPRNHRVNRVLMLKTNPWSNKDEWELYNVSLILKYRYMSQK